MGLENEDILELTDRYNFLVVKYVELAISIAPRLDEFGRYRKELQTIVAEFVRRNIIAKTPEDLERKVQEEINKRLKKINGEIDKG
jgi:hypothetical protein